MKIIITESQLENSISEMKNMGDFLPLMKYWKKIEIETGKEVSLKNLIDEVEISGIIKRENGGLDNNAVKAFGELQKKCPGLKMDEDSYRTYDKQTELFIDYVKKYGSIEGAMKLRAIPGFSQHHTGKAFDVEPKSVRACVRKNAESLGFSFPYLGQNETRVAEPWHIYFKS